MAARRGDLRRCRGALRADRARACLRAAVLLPAADRPFHRRSLARAGEAAVVSRRRPGHDRAARPPGLPEGPRTADALARPPHPGRRRAAGVPHRGLGRVERLRVRQRALRGRLRRARGIRLRRPHACGRARRRRRAWCSRATRSRSATGSRSCAPRRCTKVPKSCAIDEMGTVAVLSLDSAADDGHALESAGRRLRRLQTALRLWDDAEPSLGPTAWARTDGGAWSAVPLATGIRRDAGDCLLGAEEEDPLRAFCSLVTRRTPRAGELAWALRRFELGCERAFAVEALTDWLLAGRALLADPETAGYDGMTERLAVDLRDARGASGAPAPARRGDPPRARRDHRPRAPRSRGRGPDRRSRRQPARDAARRPVRPPRSPAPPRGGRDARSRARTAAR